MIKKLQKNKTLLVTLLVAAGIIALQRTAFAGTSSDTSFDAIYQLIDGWVTGTLGKTIAIATFLVGMCVGIVRQSLMAIALGVGGALALNYTPSIMANIFTGVM